MKQHNEKGFTLIEVVAAIVIISLVTLTFFQFFIQSNKISTYNNEKLLVVNLANAELERLKATPTEQLFGPTSTQFTKPPESYTLYSEKTIEKSATINEASYIVKITANQTATEHAAKLLNMKVEVTGPQQNSKSTVEGYVAYE